MFNFSLNLINPWHRNDFKNLWNKSWLVTDNKATELEITKHSPDWLVVVFGISTRTDHAGVKISLGIFTYCVHLSLYDTRHWDFVNDKWEAND